MTKLPDDVARLLESVLAGQVILLARDLKRADREAGRIRVGGDYTREAAAILARERSKALRAFDLPPVAARDL